MMNTRFTHMLVPVDFSPHSAQAVRWAGYWQEHLGGRVTAFHGMQFEPPLEFTVEQIDDLVKQATRTREALEADTRAFLTGTLDRDPGWEVRVEEGDPVARILAHAEGTDLVIMGTHGRRGTRRWMLGSVAEEVLHAQRVPTLVVRESQSVPKLDRLLVPTDFSLTGNAVVEYAACLAATVGAELIVVHAVKDQHEVESARHQLCDCLPPEQQAGITVQTIVRQGRPAEQIISLAREHDADLIVMGSSPKPFLDIHILPPTVAEVVRYGTMPVLVLPEVVTRRGGRNHE